MKRYVAIVALLVLSGAGGVGCQSSKAALPEGSGFRVLTAGLADPWEITWGPGGFLWVTEKTGKKVTRENPLDGSKSAVMTITEVYHAGGQDDLLGMAFQSGPSKGGQNYVYFAYTYDAAAGAAIDRRAKIARYTYDPAAGTLNDPIDVITGRPAGDDHNGGRLLFGPDRKLYYSIGDQGNNQFDHFCDAIRSQDLPTAAEVAGKDWTKYTGSSARAADSSPRNMARRATMRSI